MRRMGHREALLEGARRCLEERGYARTTARDLVAASGTNLASIGYHFGSKEALLNEAIGQAFDEWNNRVAEIAFAAREASPLERMAASWVAILDSLEEHRPLLIAFVEALAQAERSPELREQLAAQLQRTREHVARLVLASVGQEPGEGDVVASDVASFIIAVCDGFVIQYLLDPERTPGGRQLMGSLGAALAYSLAGAPGATARS
jgi:AcrR family transcriptional regulator